MIRSILKGDHGESPLVAPVGGNSMFGKRTVAPTVVAGHTLLAHIDTKLNEVTR